MAKGVVTIACSALIATKGLPTMANLALPFAGSSGAGQAGVVFGITSSDNGSTAISGRAYGQDPRFGDYSTGVSGESNQGGIGVSGACAGSGPGVQGSSTSGPGVYGSSVSNAGVLGESTDFDGVKGVSHSAQHAGLSAVNDSQWIGSDYGNFAVWATSNGTALYARGSPAAYFEGDVKVTGDIQLINADCAEEFDADNVAGDLEPGSVVVICETGSVKLATNDYDSAVAGVVSGAGDYRPALVLHKVAGAVARVPIAMLGKVFCNVDADLGSIKTGDLLTTSATPGHAMKVVDRTRAFGAVVGKALAGVDRGRALIPILVALR
jgi:hypothetical protein